MSHDYTHGWLTVPQVAKRIGVSHTTAHRMVDFGVIPHTIHPRKRYRIVSEADVQAYIAGSKVRPGETLGRTCNPYRRPTSSGARDA